MSAWLCTRCGDLFDAEHDRCPHDGAKVVKDRRAHTVADRYQVDRLLGVGGMGSAVWSAWQVGTERPVALKLLPQPDQAARDRFARGARIASNLSHPNIVVVHDYGEVDDGLFLVMEQLEGMMLTDRLAQGPVPLDEALDILDQLLRALAHAHGKQVVHRDLKPDNLFLVPQEDGHLVKVLDFGIARFADDVEETSELAERLGVAVTGTHLVCGTPQYMAPEQILAGAIDGRTDLYAVGVLAYRLLGDRLPFPDRDVPKLLRAHVKETPPDLTELTGGAVPAEVAQVVAQALAKDPAERLASARDMRRALWQARAAVGLLSPDAPLPSMEHRLLSNPGYTPPPGALHPPSGELPTPGPMPGRPSDSWAASGETAASAERPAVVRHSPWPWAIVAVLLLGGLARLLLSGGDKAPTEGVAAAAQGPVQTSVTAPTALAPAAQEARLTDAGAVAADLADMAAEDAGADAGPGGGPDAAVAEGDPAGKPAVPKRRRRRAAPAAERPTRPARTPRSGPRIKALDEL